MNRKFNVIIIILLLLNAMRHGYLLFSEGYTAGSVILLLLSAVLAGYLYIKEFQEKK
ncbi:hypothetical protein [Salisediminibacterium beveridgei]|uniref:Uncharacterized protein n=1 Tax=Salisediminibacterium beveridgei TaxID=632773 RepID=A0A1D7QVB6_9BACI|nr:hypothetical protein [Salisediminibacterium beveridgei]AOM82947.1 hypothetical protein BBEV_1586 [Salisediminibacterium beveridgei]